MSRQTLSYNPGPQPLSCIWAGSGGGVRVDFHQEKIDQAARGFRGLCPPDVSLHPFFTWRKDVPARHECIKNHALLNRSGLRATFFCPRRQKKAKTPPGFPRTPGILSVLFSGESPHRYHKNQRYIRGHGPGDLGRHMFSVPRPNEPRGPWAPSLYGQVRVAAFELIFIERKSTKPPGGSGGSPLTLLSPLSLRKERGCQSTACALWHERIENHSLLNGFGLRATSFFPRRKKEAKTPPGVPPGPPEKRWVRYLLNRRPYNKGARGLRGSAGRGVEKRQQIQALGPLTVIVGFHNGPKNLS